jgi:hypothetical protein
MSNRKPNPRSIRLSLARLTAIKLFAATHDMSQNQAIDCILELGLGKPVTLVKVNSNAGNPQELNQLAGLVIDTSRVLKTALAALRDPHVINNDRAPEVGPEGV